MAALLGTAITLDPKEEEYAFPTKDGSTYKVKIMSMRVPELKKLCGDVGQPRSGTKIVLQERLKTFSMDTELWKLLQPGARRPHKGSRSHEKTTNENSPKKKSAYVKRREALFGDAEMAGFVQRSKDLRTEQEKKETLDWAAQMSKEFEDFQHPRAAVREKKIEAQLDTLLELIRCNSTAQIPMRPLAHSLPSLPSTSSGQAGASTALGHRLIVPLPQSDTESISVAPAPPIEPALVPVSSTNVSVPPHQPLPEPPLSLMSEPTRASGPSRVIVLADGTRITFVSSDVPDPILVSFSDDIAKLVRMWDEAALGYQADECYLKIKGYGIPLRLWEQAYKYSGDGRWKGTKDKWCKWKFIVEAYNLLGKEAFWQKYHDPKTDKPMSYTAIVEALRSERKVNDALVTVRLQEQLGDKFKNSFGYRGQQLVRASAIAKRSRTMKDTQT
ncbi:uncharacterized protein C8R40DRAFT_1070109 [Lentinula edodes]|uniref:uncharacterized protein n=1 Tax=Lentinula edodes TaxID=5353 RepID=UPI001E8E4CAB|nr:uncharacterized protein C8R40DRAFT_1070109 [Lentinula edodes]KAH7874297.1 hypothetical protein C8R40DRAFT_1070109 [Lentinula edodes]